MIVSSFFCFLAILSLFGYSYIFKKFENKKSEIEVLNDDIFIGVLLIILFSLLINFFLPLKYFVLPIFLMGLIFFFIGKKKEVFKFKIKYYFLFLFFINYLTYYNGPNVDSPLYHLQTINWIILNKINLGITNLNIRFGVNSSWHSFLALMSISFLKLNLKYYLSSIIFSVMCYSILFKKNYTTSDIFLFLSISFLLTFSLIHPFVNGPILNHLGNPEVDIIAMFLFIFCFYYFLKLGENNFQTNDENINFFIILVFLAVSTKISNLSLIFLLVIILLLNRSYKLINFSNIIISLTSILWLTRSFLITGCFIFPIKKTCMETSWTDINQIDFYSKVIQSYTRDTRLRNRWTDFDHTLYSTDWFVPWFKDYFLNTSLLKISSTLIIFSLLVLIFLSIFQNKKKYKIENSYKNFRLYFYSIIFFTLAIYIWLKAPEIRFGTGLIISLPCFLLALVCYKLELNRYFRHNYTLSATIFLFLLIFIKHLGSFELNYLYTLNKGNKDYSQIKKIADVDGVEIFQSLNSQCGDFPKICVNKKKENYKIDQKFSYRIFLNDRD